MKKNVNWYIDELVAQAVKDAAKASNRSPGAQAQTFIERQLKAEAMKKSPDIDE